jgi:metallophosphoesterase (TIGR00282 family)
MRDKYGFLFLGDIIGRPGRRALKKFLPALLEKYSPSLVVANGENAAGGIGITPDICRQLLAQVDVLTSGNHIWDKKDAVEYLDQEPRLLRPVNYPAPNPGKGVYSFETKEGFQVAIINLQGRVFMEPIDCPFRAADRELKSLEEKNPITLVDFHAEATSEKQAMGWFLDGRVAAVVGTHTHVTTADEKILPQGTAYITDVGMVGGYESVIGLKREQAIQRFLTSRPQRFEPGKSGLMLSSVYIEVDTKTKKAISIKRVVMVEEDKEDDFRG